MQQENVLLLVQNELGEIIVVSRRDDHEALGLPGGKIEQGETHLQALCREMQEELNLTLDPEQLHLLHTGLEQGTPTHVYVTDEVLDIHDAFINNENCLVTTVSELEDLTDPNVSPFHIFNYELCQAEL